MLYKNILQKVGQTPLVNIQCEELNNINLFAKLEFFNPTGSVKDRAASYILKKLIDLDEIDKDTTIIESSSGNFGVALSAYCKEYGLKFCCVADPHISPINEMLIKSFGAEVIKVVTPDQNGGYLLTRIEKVKEILFNIPNSYWINQYGNPYNAMAYFNTLGKEICDDLDTIDYVFMGVSSGGTITGVSQKIKEEFPNVKIIATDIVGSIIFGYPPKKRFIPGIGSGMVPDIIKHAKIDGVVMVDEVYTIKMCHELLQKHSIFAGGSTGSVYGAIKKYFENKKFERKPNVLMICADRGERYSNTIYNEKWYTEFFEEFGENSKISELIYKR